MYARHQLGQQVSTELKRRSYIFFTIIISMIVYVGINLTFNKTGFLSYLELREREQLVSLELDRMLAENKALEQKLENFTVNDYYVEKHAREEFGLAGPNEHIFIYKDN